MHFTFGTLERRATKKTACSDSNSLHRVSTVLYSLTKFKEQKSVRVDDDIFSLFTGFTVERYILTKFDEYKPVRVDDDI